MFGECFRCLFPNHGHDSGGQVDLSCSLWDFAELLPRLVVVFGNVSWFPAIEALTVVILSDDCVYLYGA